MDGKKVVALLAGIAAFGLTWFATRGLFSKPGPTSARFLSGVASEVNKTLPMMLDKDTEFVSATGLEGTFVYNYRLVNHGAGDLDVAVFNSKMQPLITNAACTRPETRDGFLRKGVVLRYAYADRDRNHVTTIDVTPADCGP
ncbi:MAG: hypothetical protein JNJ54_08555 [Myxococcaceae bacterium]|nr:hypothetical protein [Myxococcaceae bacterium]